MKLSTLALLAFGISLPLGSATAQQAEKVYRIGYLQAAPRNVQLELIEAFESGLRERGYVIGRNALIEYRFADGRLERLPELADDLVRLKVDVIVTGVNANVRAAQRATTTIPIVTAISYYPVEDGLVASLGRPGANVTGLTQDSGEEVGKRLQLLREVVPGLTRVATLSGTGMSYTSIAVKKLERVARDLGITVLPFEIQGAGDVEHVFAQIERSRAEGLIVLSGPIIYAQRASIISITTKKRLPAVWDGHQAALEGALIAYGADILDLFRRATDYVDRILKGAKPADLPIEQPTKYLLAINVKTARALGMTMPPSLLLQATHVIE